MTDLDLTGELSEALRSLLSWLFASGELLVRGLVLLAAALAGGWAAGRITCFLLRRFDAWSERVGVQAALGRFGIGRPLSQVLGRAAFVLTGLLVAQLGAATIGLPALGASLGGVLSYAPRILLASAILLGGMAAAGHIRRAASQAASNAGIEYAQTLGTLVFAAIVFAAGLLAVSQLRITTDAVWLLLGWILAGLALALGLSFGLGARESARDILAGLYARRIFRLGQQVEIGSHRGVLISITPTNALIEQEDAIVSVSNSRLLREIVRQSKQPDPRLRDVTLRARRRP